MILAGGEPTHRLPLGEIRADLFADEVVGRAGERNQTANAATVPTQTHPGGYNLDNPVSRVAQPNSA